MMKSLLSPRFLVFLFTCAASLLSLAGAAPDTTQPADIANMKSIGAALNAYKKAKGEFPDHLSNLVPKFLDAKTLVSPLGIDADPKAAKGGNDPKLPCSYEYEFSTDVVRDFNRGNHPRRAINLIEFEEYGPTTPLLRCFLYPQALNLSHGGDLFHSDENDSWFACDEAQLLLTKNGYGPGMQAGKKLNIHLTDEAGQPVAGVALAVSNRESSGIDLPNRDFTSNAQGEVALSLGTDNSPKVTFMCLRSPWFLASCTCTFGDPNLPAKGDLASTTVVLRPAAPIGGVVHDAQGHPVPRARVALETPAVDPDPDGEPDQVDFISFALTDEQGKWELPSFPKKKWEGIKLFLSADTKPLSRMTEASPGDKGVPDAAALFARTADLRLLPLFPVKGTVVSHGWPVPGATVVLRGPVENDQQQAVTDAQGQFEFSACAEHTANFSVLAENLAPLSQKVKLAVDGPSSRFTLESGAPAKARLVDAGHQPLPNVTVLFHCFDGVTTPSLPTQPVIGVTDANGRFTWEHAPNLPVQLQLLLPSGETEILHWKPAQPGETELRVAP